MQYLDFDLSVDARGDGEYEISVRHPGGQVRARTRTPFEQPQLATFLRGLEAALEVSRSAQSIAPSARDVISERREVDTTERFETVRTFGQSLFEALLPGRVLVAYRASMALAAKEGRGLRVQLRIQAPEMAALPWEFMFDPDDSSFVCLNASTPIVRYPELDRAPATLSIDLPLRILAMVASPGDLPRLDKDAERRKIEGAVKRLRAGGKVDLQWVPGGTYRDLQAAMREGPWHVFHFIGHGDFETDAGARSTGILALEATSSMPLRFGTIGATGAATSAGPPAHLVPAEVVGQLLQGHQSLRLVVLNCCLGARASPTNIFSSTATTLVRRGLPAVVAMQYQITDRAAITFAQAFYASLVDGTPVDRAVVDARCAINAQTRDSIEWGIPVLFMRSPTGELVSPARREPVQRRQPLSLWRRAAACGLVALPLVTAGLLALVRAPRTNIALTAQVTRVGFVLPNPQPLGDPIAVRVLGASGLAAFDLPVAVPGGAEATSDRVLLTALKKDARQGRIDVDLTTVLSAGTRVNLAASNEPGAYELSLSDSIPDIRVGLLGPVQIVVPGRLNEEADFAAPAVVRLHPDAGVVGLDFGPVERAPSSFGDKLPANQLNLIALERFESPSGTVMREASAIRSGQLALETAPGKVRRLGPNDELRLGGVQGRITRLALAGDHLDLKLAARVEQLTSGSGSTKQNLMPSLLALAISKHRYWVVGAVILYTLALATPALRWWRQST